ncbi:hypothetical protein SOV_24900 [Sporomusa ovata DSM 2662]|uniref:Uncharacterized protein n=1 Tax=Sporomusa ovata TaxID=2378 RepID=A0A0U1L4D1_9FIRM|nr:hypothetical protein [Sporomusa ovata]EQB25802.1 hypothetical protein SOV_4c04690 [Sporomusa ovata DSM 2662]CQR74365.1 hypothetical protein SpAn4DRAFT_0827 [Sporomusa ovata]
MAKTDTPKKEITPIVKITWMNYDPAKHNEYSKKFMAPIIDGILQRLQLSTGE